MSLSIIFTFELQLWHILLTLIPTKMWIKYFTLISIPHNINFLTNWSNKKNTAPRKTLNHLFYQKKRVGIYLLLPLIPWVAVLARWLPRMLKLHDWFPVGLRLHQFILCTRCSGCTATAHEGGGCDQSIGSAVSDVIVRRWLWSTATRSSPLGHFSRLLQVVNN